MGRVSQRIPNGRAAQATVRVTDADRHGFVEFQFALNDPALYLEMTLPSEAFRLFCAEHGARHLSPEEARAVDAAEHKWRFGNEDED